MTQINIRITRRGGGCSVGLHLEYKFKTGKAIAQIKKSQITLFNNDHLAKASLAICPSGIQLTKHRGVCESIAEI